MGSFSYFDCKNWHFTLGPRQTSHGPPHRIHYQWGPRTCHHWLQRQQPGITHRPRVRDSSIGTCDLSTARGLVNSIFSTAAQTPAKNLIQTIENAGARTEASTNAGFDLFAWLAANGVGTPSDRSSFVNAILPCQNFGTQSLSLPIDFTGAFGPNGAFAVRGALPQIRLLRWSRVMGFGAWNRFSTSL